MEIKYVVKGRLPGLNEYTAAQRENRYHGANMKRKYQGIVLAEVLQSGHWHLKAPIWISYRFYEPNRRRDKDNISGFAHKVINDALVKARVIPDDGWDVIQGYQDEFFVDRKHPRIEIVVREVCDGK